MTLMPGEPIVPGAAAPSASRKGPAELKALTGVRFFAAFFVVIYHYERLALTGTPQFVQNIAGTGYIFVDFFFLLSGFVLAYSNIKDSGTPRTSAASFWAARIGRIYPAYLTAFLIIAPFNFVRTMGGNHFSMGLAKLTTGGALVLAMVQSWSPWSAWYWNFPAWSLSVEMFFYLMFPILVPFIGKLDRRACIRLLPVVWLIGLLAPAAFTLLHSWSAEPPFHKIQFAIEVTPIFRLPEFICGVLLGRIYFLDPRRERKTGGLLAYAGIAGMLTVLGFSDIIPRPLLANGLIAPMFGLVIFGLAQGRGFLAAFLSTPLFVLLGEASYGIYILQYPIASVFGVVSDVYTPVRTACFIVSLITLSILCFRYIESPLRGRIRRALTGPLEALVLWFTNRNSRSRVARSAV